VRRLALLLLVATACGGRDAKPAPPAAPSADAQLAAAIDEFMDGHLAFRPGFAIGLGYHAYDGAVPDRSEAAITAEIARLHAARATFEAIDPAALSAQPLLEREVVLAEIRKELFELEARRRPWRDPFFYVRGFSLLPYVARDYAAPEVRAAAMLRACEGAPAYYAQAAANLEPALPRPWLQIGVMMSDGAIGFLNGDARAAFADLADAGLRDRLGACLTDLAAAVQAFRDGLAARMPAATDDFRLGAEGLIEMLRETEGLDLDLETLQRVAQADLEKNRAAITAAAAEIDPNRPVADVVAEVSADKPAPDQVLAEATAQVEQLRAFVIEHDVVSVPRDDVVEVRASPSFMRGNFAAFSGVGPFETTPLPSVYYIAPPDPAWPAEEQLAYLPSRADLLFISAHEVWPGHFIQGMHQRASGSRVLQTFETYTASEGWAHYVEEMLWDAGLGGGDPRAHIGQLKNALLRDVRFLVALGYHAGDLTVDEAIAMFREQAFADPGNARQQAMRGTADPMFLGYTLGKLIIQELRAGHKGSLRSFHDAFLRHGEAPLSVTRRLMLGPDAGPLLKPR
jgi:uncharacterized protein (DUF885 family)